MSGREDKGKLEQTEQPLERLLEKRFNVDVERRMRTALFVSRLYGISETDALIKLRDPKFLGEVIKELNHHEGYFKTLGDLMAVPEEETDKVKEAFRQMVFPTEEDEEE